MEKQKIRNLLEDRLFRIPDYQRGYAWEEKQWTDFADDLDALIDEKITNHYAGTIVTFTPQDEAPTYYGNDKIRYSEVVDGQQRLTTCLIYLSIIIKELIAVGQTSYEKEVERYLYEGSKTRLRLNNDTQDVFYDLLRSGDSNTVAQSQHQQRLVQAYAFFKEHIGKIEKTKRDERLRHLYEAITSKLVFTSYEIENRSEIGMTFELMNSRGKGLSTLELLKNYFMHWVYRNLHDNPSARDSLTELINKHWKSSFQNIGSVNGSEDQVLRTAWILMCTPTPKNWKGYTGFKEPAYFPIKGFSQIGTNKGEIQIKIQEFISLLAIASKHYAAIKRPTLERVADKDEAFWLDKLNHGGNTANFLPLLISARILTSEGKIEQPAFIKLIESLEIYSYRVFLFEGKRSNAGKSRLFSMAHELYHAPSKLPDFIKEIHGLVNWYSETDNFHKVLDKPDTWYHWGRLLKYTLYEYELELLGGRKEPKISWNQISDTTLEHILPQNPDVSSDWLKSWTREEIEKFQHDIGNICLTLDNSSYQNFEFTRKKGSPSVAPSYSTSGIRQEQDIASYPQWTAEEVQIRRGKIVSWIKTRWATIDHYEPEGTSLEEDEDLEEVST